MTFLPVVERELRVASRRRGTYWGRFTAGLIGAVLAAWTLLALAKQGEKIVGGFLFVVVSSVIFLYATVAGTLVTCDCLSEEKREGTLGLLFLTDLKGRDVVLGKLAATSIHAFFRLLAFLPMLAIPFILGGVTRAEMLRVVLVAINLLFFFLSLGLFVSAICRKDNWALGLAIIIGLALALGGPVMTQFNHFPYPQVALISSPATGCFLAFDSNYAASPLSLINLPGCFWGNAALTHIYGWIFFGLACWFVPRSWQDAAVERKMPSSLATPPARRARIRLELLEINPFLWRVARSGRKSLLVWLTMFVLAALWLAYVRWLSLDYLEPGLDVLVLVQAGLVLKAWLAVEASRTFSEDYHSGGLELLLSTPLQEKDIVRGQCMALWRQFGPPVIAVLLAYLFFMILLVRRWQFQEREYWLVIHVILGGFLVGDMMALSWVGMWLGLIHRKPNRAALQALLRILVLPPVIFVVLISLVRNPPVAAAYTLWAVLGLGANLCFALQARTKLRSQFRTIVSEGVARKPPVEPVPGTAAILMETP